MEHGTRHTRSISDRYADLVSSNSPPTDAARHDIQQNQTEIQSKLLALDVEMKALKERLASLQSEKEALLKDEETCRLLNAPLRRVPMDVLIEIFELVSAIGRPSPKRAPLLLCQVCRRWRDTVIRTPRLWRTLWILVQPTLNIFESNMRYTEAQTLADLWLSRAKDTPLDLKIELRFNGKWGSFTISQGQAFLKNILERCQQSVRTFSLHISYLDELLHNLVPHQLQFPKLLEVRLSSDERTDSWPMLDGTANEIIGTFGITTFQGAKNLQKMICSSEGVRPILVPSYSSLTCLLIGRALDTTEWFECFRHFSQLETGLFHLENPIDNQISTGQLETSSFRNLKRLYIYHIDQFLCAPFHSFEFPALEDFRIYFGEQLSSPEVLYGTMPNVRHLAIRCGEDQGLGHLSALKDSFQDVVEFECSVRYQDLGQLFTILSATSNSKPRLPRMKKITLRVTSDWEEWEGPGGIFSRDDTMQAILSRWSPTERHALFDRLNHIRFIIKDEESSDMASEEFDELLEILDLDADDDSLSEHFTWEVSENSHLGNSKVLIHDDALDLENCGIRFRYESIEESELGRL